MKIKQYFDCRYVLALEACWRINEFNLHGRNPSVERLQYHLQNQHIVVFNDDDSLTSILKRPEIEKTMLTEWFVANRQCPEARDLRYVDFPVHWTWKSKEKVRSKRKGGRCIGRLYYAHPTAGERYYLRMLLHVMRGPTCYEDLKTVNEKLYNSFKEACISFGLLNDDNKWKNAIRETSNWATGYQLRSMFAKMLMFCEISNSSQIWNKHWRSISDDIEMGLQRQENSINDNLFDAVLQNQTLMEIESILNKNGRSLKEFSDMPFPTNEYSTLITNRILHDEMSYDVELLASEFDVLFSKLNREQSTIFHKIVNSCMKNKAGVYFVNGSGGSRKTYLPMS